MTDLDLTTAQRLAAQGDPQQAALALRLRIRKGELAEEQVKLAALLEDAGSRELFWHEQPACANCGVPVWAAEKPRISQGCDEEWFCSDECEAVDDERGCAHEEFGDFRVMPFAVWTRTISRLAADAKTDRRVKCPNECNGGWEGPGLPGASVGAWCQDCNSLGTVLATEECSGCGGCRVVLAGDNCHGTGRVPETFEQRLLVLCAVRCAREMPSDGTAPRQWTQIKRAVNAAEAWALNPSRENLREWDTACEILGPDVEWVPWSGCDAAQVVQSAARVLGEPTTQAHCNSLAPWVLGTVTR